MECFVAVVPGPCSSSPEVYTGCTLVVLGRLVQGSALRPAVEEEDDAAAVSVGHCQMKQMETAAEMEVFQDQDLTQRSFDSAVVSLEVTALEAQEQRALNRDSPSS